MHPIATNLAGQAADVARFLLGKPSSQSGSELRFRRRGSLSVVISGPKCGLWHDHESGEGGDLLSLIERERNVDFAKAVEIAQSVVGGAGTCWSIAKIESNRPSFVDDAKPRMETALRLWHEAVAIDDTPAERYLANRGLPGPHECSPHAIRWHPVRSFMVALMTDPVTGEPSGIHRTFLDAQNRKTERKMLGRQGVVRISPDEDVTFGLGICEGIEDALALIVSGWSPVWAVTCAGALSRFPVPSEIQALTIVSDADVAGLTAAETCAARWREAGREVKISVLGGFSND